MGYISTLPYSFFKSLNSREGMENFGKLVIGLSPCACLIYYDVVEKGHLQLLAI
jgi:hypothetical protein